MKYNTLQNPNFDICLGFFRIQLVTLDQAELEVCWTGTRGHIY